MPYRRRYPKRRPSRFRGGNRSISYGQIGKKIWRDVKWLKSVINVEKKFIDTSGTPTPSTTATVTLLNSLAQGDGMSTRDGQSVKFISMLLNYTATINSSATQTFLRVMLVRDKQPNAALGIIGTLLINATDVNSPLLLGSALRYKVLYDKRIALAINGRENHIETYYRKVNFHTRFNTNSDGGVDDIVTNSVFIVLLSSEATNTPTVNFTTRMRFIDN